jgi:hypothetical protein
VTPAAIVLQSAWLSVSPSHASTSDSDSQFKRGVYALVDRNTEIIGAYPCARVEKPWPPSPPDGALERKGKGTRLCKYDDSYPQERAKLRARELSGSADKLQPALGCGETV